MDATAGSGLILSMTMLIAVVAISVPLIICFLFVFYRLFLDLGTPSGEVTFGRPTSIPDIPAAAKAASPPAEPPAQPASLPPDDESEEKIILTDE